MTIRHLRIFLAVADSGTMSQAAKQLYITQPSVSQAIRELEERYQVLLFERLGKKLYITEAGKTFYSHAKQVIVQLDQMEEYMLRDLREKLRIGATVTVGSRALPEIVREFRLGHPQIDVYGYGGNTRTIEEKLLAMELDVGIIEGKVQSPDLISIPMIDDYLVLVCGMEHPFMDRKKLYPSDLEGREFVMREQGSGTRALFENYLEKHRVQIKVVFEESSPAAILKAVQVNQCLAVLSVSLIENELREGKLKAFAQEEQEWNRKFSFVYHKDKFLTEGICDLEEIVKNYGEKDVLAKLPVGRLLNSRKK